MLRRLSLAICALLIGGFALAQDAKKDEAKKDDAKDDAKLLQGEWKAVTLERDGEKAPEDRIKEFKLTFKDDTVTARFVAKFTLDATKKPKAINVVPSDGPEKDKTIEGIYELKGDDLKICIAVPGNPRPTEFASKNAMLMTMKKAK